MLIDAIIFFDEKELVKLRMEYLSSIVDYFVVVEANITHQGRDKEWNFEKILENDLKQFSKKIKYHKLNIDIDKVKQEESWIHENDKGDNAWQIENYQRNFIKTACNEFSNNDILIISDVDEIPSKSKLESIHKSLKHTVNKIIESAKINKQWNTVVSKIPNKDIAKKSVINPM